MEHNIYLALGSNLGDRAANLRLAIEVMPPKVIPITCSSIYQTPPWGFIDQPAFLNQVVLAETDLDPEDLLRFIKSIEKEIGREPAFRYGPRLIDLDILLYDEIILETPELTIPHPRMAERAFVLVPLADIAPDFCHPIHLLSISDMLARVAMDGIAWFSPGECGKMDNG